MNNHQQTLDGTKTTMQVYLAVAGIGGHTQAQINGFPVRYYPRLLVGETGKHEQLLQIDCASVGSSDTVSSLLLMLSTPSEEV